MLARAEKRQLIRNGILDLLLPGTAFITASLPERRMLGALSALCSVLLMGLFLAMLAFPYESWSGLYRGYLQNAWILPVVTALLSILFHFLAAKPGHRKA